MKEVKFKMIALMSQTSLFISARKIITATVGASFRALKIMLILAWRCNKNYINYGSIFRANQLLTAKPFLTTVVSLPGGRILEAN